MTLGEDCFLKEIGRHFSLYCRFQTKIMIVNTYIEGGKIKVPPPIATLEGDMEWMSEPRF